MLTTLIVIHVVICILLIVTVLLQFGKGAEAGAIMGGGGASQAVFSSSAKGNFMTKLTTALAIGFMVNSIILTTLKSRESRSSLFDNEAPVAAPLNSDTENLKAKPTTPAGEAKTTAPVEATASPTATVPATTNPEPAQKPVQQ